VVARLEDEAVGCGGFKRVGETTGEIKRVWTAPSARALFRGVMTADGDAIVSGLLLADVAGVLAFWRAQGFHLAERIELEGWASLRLRR
jgi:hypothetical protein